MAIDLQRILSEVGDLVPVVPPRVSELKEAARELHTRAQAALERLEKLPEAAEEVGDALEETAREAEEVVREAAEGRRERLDELDEARTELTESMERWSGEVEDAIERARRSLDALKEQFEADGALSSSERQAAGSLDRYAGELHTASPHVVETRLDTERRVEEQLQNPIRTAQERIAGALAEVVGRIQDAREQVEDAVESAKESTEGALQELRDTLDSAAEATAQSLQTAREDFGESVGQTAAAARERTAAVCATVAGGAESLREVADDTDLAQGALDPLFEGVSVLLQPAEAALDAIKAAAGLVGLK